MYDETTDAGTVVEVDADDFLPDAEHHFALGERHSDRGAYEASTGVGVAVGVGVDFVVFPAVVLWCDVFKDSFEVGIAARFVFDGGDAAR